MVLQKKRWILVIMLSLLCGVLFWLQSAQSAQAASYPRVIAHGCGAVRGETVTNSLEALEQAIANGYQYIEVDMAFTTDGEIAMIHDWESSASYYLGVGQNKSVSFARYQQCKVLNNYTPLTMEKLAEILQQHPQVHIITDTKESNVEILTFIQKKYPQVVKQIIPQIYQYDEWEAVNKLGYQQIILTLYKMPSERNSAYLAKFVQEKGIYAVTMSVDLANTGLAKALQSYGIAVYMHTVNTLKQTVTALNAGAYGIYSDILLPEEVTYPGWQYYLARSNNNEQLLSVELQQGQLKLNMRSSNRKGSVAYYIKGELLAQGDLNKVLKTDISHIATGQHVITARLYNGTGQHVATKSYLIWKDKNSVLLATKQCQYILDQFTSLSDFSAAMQNYAPSTQQLAEKSFFARLGSAVYYNNGRTGLYLSGSTLLPAIAADSSGNIYTAMSDTAIALGASSAQMNGTTKALDVKYGGKQYQIGIRGTTKSYRKNIPILKSTIQLYRNRAIGDGQVYTELTGRECIQENGYLILLPKGSKATEVQREELLEIAQGLYQ